MTSVSQSVSHLSSTSEKIKGVNVRSENTDFFVSSPSHSQVPLKPQDEIHRDV